MRGAMLTIALLALLIPASSARGGTDPPTDPPTDLPTEISTDMTITTVDANITMGENSTDLDTTLMDSSTEMDTSSEAGVDETLDTSSEADSSSAALDETLTDELGLSSTAVPTTTRAVPGLIANMQRRTTTVTTTTVMDETGSTATAAETSSLSETASETATTAAETATTGAETSADAASADTSSDVSSETLSAAASDTASTAAADDTLLSLASSADTSETADMSTTREKRSTDTSTQAAVATNATEQPAAANATQQRTTTAAASGQAETNATQQVTTTEAVSTTTVTTTTEPLPSIIAKVRSSMKIINHEYTSWMALSITRMYQDYTSQIAGVIRPVLENDLSERFIDMEIVGLRRGSVIVDLDVTVDTQQSNISKVDTNQIAGEISTSLQGIIDTGSITFDPASVVADPSSIDLVEPTEAPPNLEDLYRSTNIRMEMRAPNANYTDMYNLTDSEEFKALEVDINEGIKAMLVKKYPPTQWNISTTLEAAWNDSQKGIGIRFRVEMEPQWANTTETVMTLAKYYVYFSRIGSLQIDPESVKFEDLTTYRPSDGVVIKNEEYYRKLRERLYNGSYVGDYTTARPTLRPIVKRHKGYVMGIALPAFLGMLAAVGLLLICTTIAGGNKKPTD